MCYFVSIVRYHSIQSLCIVDSIIYTCIAVCHQHTNFCVKSNKEKSHFYNPFMDTILNNLWNTYIEMYFIHAKTARMKSIRYVV